MAVHASVEAVREKLPIVALNDELIVVATRMFWDPPITTGVPAGRRENMSFTSPQFVPRVLPDGSC